ncbi:MAG: (d)CMP kinase [Pseudomonadota bacterium]|nr:(d)CMP kinase [Pseudomonadota bacterium]
MTAAMTAPVIAIDGPAASGKGTVASGVAVALGFHLLDSGALYRLVAYKALSTGADPDREEPVTALAAVLGASFGQGRVALDGVDVTEAIRSENVSAAASRVAVHRRVRAALLERQRAFRQPPGLVADGRDMGTVVFPDAALKVFVTATAAERAHRRYKQLIEKGNQVTLDSLLRDIQERDRRDATRSVAPLEPAADAHILDTTGVSVAEAIAFVLSRWQLAVGS